MNEFPSLKLIKKGKVRDIWEVDNEHLLICSTDRVSVFDSILPTMIPGRGDMLATVTRYWCNKTKWIMPNHISRSKISIGQVLSDSVERPNDYRNCEIVRKYTPLPIEAIVRGYLYGHAWREYSEHGTMNGVPLPEGMQKAQAFNYLRFTPTTKAPIGEHDRPMSQEEFYDVLGADLADDIVNHSIYLYEYAAKHLLTKGYILADTKFEFAVDEEDGRLVLIDEVITSDNSRIWSQNFYKLGQNQVSYDKEIIREYVTSYIAAHPNEMADISKIVLPDEVVTLASDRYRQFAVSLILGEI